MARQLRIVFEYAYYHIMSRGIRKENIFPDDKSKFKFIEYLDKNLIKFNVICFAYCIMDNHFHLFIQTPEPNLPDFMKVLNNSYATWYTKKKESCGAVFAGRYKSIVVDSESYALTLVNYIHQNPIKKFGLEIGLSYPHSSLGYYLGIKTKTIKKLNRKLILKYFGKCLKDSFDGYLNNLNKQIEEKDIKRKIYKKSILGDKKFIDDIDKKYLNPGVDNKDLITSVDSRPRGYKEILKIISNVTNLPEENIIEQKYNNFYRVMTMKILSENTRLKNREIGKIFGINGNSVLMNIKNFDKKIDKNIKVQNLYHRILQQIRK
ncbi:MAG: transposase [Candidatus Muiribacteriota bacterium]